MSLTAQTIRTLLAALLLCFCATQVKPQNPADSGSSTMRGVVVYADTGHPLRHARVTIVAMEREWQMDTVSDLRGRFVFENLPAGKFAVSASAPGILNSDSDDARNDDFIPKRRYARVIEPFTEVVVNGTDSVEVKVRAVRGGVITGRVVTEDDQPVVNAEVRLLCRDEEKGAATWIVSSEWGAVKTDAVGVYRFAGLPSGEYAVRASEPSLPGDRVPGDEDAYSDGSFMVAYHPAATLLKDAQAVSVTVGTESTGIDIRMTDRAPHVLTGTVTLARDNTAAANLPVRIERNDERGVERGPPDVATHTDSQGKWRVAGLPAGDYLVTIGGIIRIDPSKGIPHAESLRKRHVVRIRDEKIVVLNTRLSSGGLVQGRVTLDGNPPEEWPGVITGVTLIEKAATSNTKRDEIEESGFTNGLVRSNGEFLITALAPGSYWFTVTTVGDELFYVESVTRKGVDLMQTSFKIAEGSVLEDVVVTLATDFARVEGHVTPPAKRTASDAVVLIAPANEWTRRFTTGIKTVPTNAEGKFVFKSGPGEYLIMAVTAAEYKKLEPKLSNDYVDKNAEKFVRIKLTAGEKKKGLTVPLSQ